MTLTFNPSTQLKLHEGIFSSAIYSYGSQCNVRRRNVIEGRDSKWSIVCLYFHRFDFDSMESFQNAKHSTPSKSYLAFDGSNGISVADRSNNRIFLVDLQLTEGQIIKLPDSSTELFQESLTSKLCYLFDKHYGQFIEIPQPPYKDHIDINHGDRTWTSVSIFGLRYCTVDHKSLH